MDQSQRHPGGWLPWALLLGVAMLPRLLGMFDALWLDEIWSLDLARRIDGPLDIFTSLHHDNNHYLNTLWMWWWGPDAPAPLHRLLSFAAGVVTLFVVVRLGGGIDSHGGRSAGLLFGVSYPFIHYASEARGYALVVLAALAAYGVLRELHRHGGWRWAWLYGVVATVGLAAHLTFATVLFPFLAWSAWRALEWWRKGWPVAQLMTAHAIPVAALGFLFWVDVRFVERGGGPSVPPIEGLVAGWVQIFGLPGGGLVALLASVAILGALGRGFLLEAKENWGAGLALWLVLFMPILLAVVGEGAYAPLRYFLVPLAFALLLTARGLARWWVRGGAMRGVAALLLSVVVVGNGWRVAQFLRDGRGGYPDAVARMADATEGDTIRVGSDHDFRNRMILDHYRRILPAGRVLHYVANEDLDGVRPPDWFIVSVAPGGNPPSEIHRFRGTAYRLDRGYPKFGLSGATWTLYRR